MAVGRTGSNLVLFASRLSVAAALPGRDPGGATLALDGLGIPEATLPPTMLAVEYAPHAALFPRAAAVVHHGGIGTTAAVLRAGRPMLVVPHAHDQPDNAFRAERLGLARVLDARRYRADRVADHLRTLLTMPSYLASARAIAARIGQEDGARTAADTMAAHASGTSNVS